MACRLYLADNIVGRHLNWTDLRQHGSRARIRGQLADSSNVAAEHELGGGSKRRREARRRRRGGGHARRASFARRARMASRRPDRARASAERRARRARGGEAQREGSERRLLSPRPERRAVSRYSRTKFASRRSDECVFLRKDRDRTDRDVPVCCYLHSPDRGGAVRGRIRRCMRLHCVLRLQFLLRVHLDPHR